MVGGGNYIGLDVKFVNRGKISLGSNVIIRPSSCIFANNEDSCIAFGVGTEIGNHSTVSAIHEVVFEENVLTGPHVFVSDHNHDYRNVDTPVCKQGIMAMANSKVVIGEGSWLGTNAVVVGNVHIGKHCVIGANSVVTKDIPDFSVAAGIPARVIKRYDFEKNEWIKV
jgi:acetyltransferase-like isoleucine patch superfamily enzyme